MKVCEIFNSCQGEGRLTGYPAVFVRFAGCNLYLDVERFGRPHPCEFCDSKYSWGDADATDVSVSSLLARIHRFKTKMVVLTGGEPLYQPENELTELVGQLKKEQFTVCVETNGTIRPPLMLELLVDHYEISPKLHIGKDELRWGMRSHGMSLKFVYDENEDKLHRFITRCVDFFKCSEVRVMPRCKNREEFLKMAEKTISFCRQYGYIFGCREHIVIWDGERRK
ncbi:hypothetical protein DRO59_03415 [Candidatus Bathyarchaeota archaeon]|nr:MAG: hypothetical protein DRO59_03415 [Candidatus Bathyarchaeota archaeon]